jgi:hypothetical protein
MFCEIVLSVGLSFGCVDHPKRDLAAEVLVEQEKRGDAEVDEAKERRNRLYHGLGECQDCGKLNTVPFPMTKE